MASFVERKLHTFGSATTSNGILAQRAVDAISAAASSSTNAVHAPAIRGASAIRGSTTFRISTAVSAVRVEGLTFGGCTRGDHGSGHLGGRSSSCGTIVAAAADAAAPAAKAVDPHSALCSAVVAAARIELAVVSQRLEPTGVRRLARLGIGAALHLLLSHPAVSTRQVTSRRHQHGA